MRAIKVEYTTKADFVEQNKKNIEAVMAELRGKGDVGVKYSSYIKEDGRTFVHFVMLGSEEGSEVVPSLEAFKTFQNQLKENLEVPPKTETLELVGASFDF